jgi:hypothetical protein
LVPSDVPKLLSPSQNTGESPYELVCADTLDDTQDGLYKIRLTDTTGRSWDVWHFDEPGSGGTNRITAYVPKIELNGGQPLADGPLIVVVSLLGLPEADFDVSGFLWSELDARAEVRAHTAPKYLQQP